MFVSENCTVSYYFSKKNWPVSSLDANIWKKKTFSAHESTEELCLITLKNDIKFEENSICCLKKDKNLVNFDASTQKSQIFALWLVNFVQGI